MAGGCPPCNRNDHPCSRLAQRLTRPEGWGSGPVYKLNNVADFGGRYTQSTGPAGLSTSGGSDLWLQNSAGVIMHLQGSSTGAMLTLGRDEIFARMSQ